MNILSIKQKDFTLCKVKVLKEGFYAEFESVRVEKETSFVDKHTIECDELPHDDLFSVFNSFKHCIVEAANSALGVNALLKNKLILDQKMKPETLKKYKDQIMMEIEDNIDVKSIQITSSGDVESFKVGGGFNSTLGYSNLTSPKIILDDSAKHNMDIDDLLENLNILRDEVFNYIIKNKRAQLSLFDGDKGTEQAAEKKAS